MLTIKNVKVYDLRESVIASGNAMRVSLPEYSDAEFERGLVRMRKLVNASKAGEVKCHDNALCGIRVSFDVVYPQYWSMEFQRYHFADIVTSSSKMHRIMLMNIGDACNEYVDERVVAVLNEKIRLYNQEKTNERFMEVISNVPMGLELCMRVSTNYKQLQTIYHQRKNHKLHEWRYFCEWVKSLPYAKTLILGEDSEKND